MKKQFAGTVISKMKAVGIALIAAGALTMSVGAEQEYIPGTNMDDAVQVPLGEKIYGATADGLTYWYCFETEEAGNYVVSAVNKTQNSEDLTLSLHDDLGTDLADMGAKSKNGWIGSMTSELGEGQTYYIKINTYDNRSDALDYVFVVEKEDSETAGNTLQADTGSYAEEGEVPGINMDDAIVFPVNEKLTGKTANGNMFWYLFETGGEEESEYAISVINKTAGGTEVEIYLTDENGNQIQSFDAYGNGEAATIKPVLSPGSIYYVCLRTYDNRSDELEYSLTIKGEEGSGSFSGGSQPASQGTQTGEAEETDAASEEEDIFD